MDLDYSIFLPLGVWYGIFGRCSTATLDQPALLSPSPRRLLLVKFSLTCSHWNKIIDVDALEADAEAIAALHPSSRFFGLPTTPRIPISTLSSSLIQVESLDWQIERLRQSNESLRSRLLTDDSQPSSASPEALDSASVINITPPTLDEAKSSPITQRPGPSASPAPIVTVESVASELSEIRSQVKTVLGRIRALEADKAGLLAQNKALKDEIALLRKSQPPSTNQAPVHPLPNGTGSKASAPPPTPSQPLPATRPISHTAASPALSTSSFADGWNAVRSFFAPEPRPSSSRPLAASTGPTLPQTPPRVIQTLQTPISTPAGPGPVRPTPPSPPSPSPAAKNTTLLSKSETPTNFPLIRTPGTRGRSSTSAPLPTPSPPALARSVTPTQLTSSDLAAEISALKSQFGLTLEALKKSKQAQVQQAQMVASLKEEVIMYKKQLAQSEEETAGLRATLASLGQPPR